MEKQVDLSQVVNLEKYAREFSSLGCDYVFSRVDSGVTFGDFARGPMRVKGMTMILCLKGNIHIEVNMTDYELEPDMLMVVGNNNILNVHDIDCPDLDAYLLVISPEFLADINIDISVLQTIKFTPTVVPVLSLSPKERDLLCRFMELIHTNTSANGEPMYIRNISRCIMAALVYQMMQFGRDRMADKSLPPSQTRRTNYVRQFISLVHKHHRSHRSVAFYAEQLFISPKYLSMLVKEASGKSAAEWIDEYVILEAKNLLRFSGMNIQQVAFTLHFSNQSAFGKYFKHLTGMSPSEFQSS